jgi:xanthine dehydrogenase accessory factor
MPVTVVIRGAGDLASGVALRLHRVGVHVAMTELPQPLAVRRTVSFAEAIYEGSVTVEGVTARRITDPTDLPTIVSSLAVRNIPVFIDPGCGVAGRLHPLVIVDARMTKKPPERLESTALLYIGLGPGFNAPANCQAVIETERGHSMGRVIWEGSARQDSRLPDGDPTRILRSPADGRLVSSARIGQHFEARELIASIGGETIAAPFSGTLRGLLRPGLDARRGMKIGDIDARDDPMLCTLVSDKSLAVGGGVLEAILARPEVRSKLWA